MIALTLTPPTLALIRTALAVALGLVGAGALLASRRRLAGTTLIAAWSWMLFSVVVLSASAALTAWFDQPPYPTWLLPFSFAASASTFCPLMAVLGAKRPQDQAWQFIVLALWIILCLPAAEWWLVGDGQPQPMHPARSFFLAVLVVVGAMNNLPTRFWPSCLLFSAGQIVLLAPYIPLASLLLPFDVDVLTGLALIVAAIVLAALGWPRRRADPRALDPCGIDRVWLDFRDLFGAVWGLRIAERINTLSRQQGWNVVLTWQGLAAPDEESAPMLPLETVAALGDALRTLLRRFVSPEWIAQRLNPPLD